jgi:hypothetical protein
MSETQLTKNADAMHLRLRNASFLQRKLPYIAVLTLAVSGVAYTNISHQSLVGYWEFLAVATGVLCVVTEWEHAQDKQARFQLMWTQALHWVAILVTMNIVLLSGVQRMLPSPATSLVLLTLLALGSFSCRSQSSVPASLLFGPRDGSRGAGDRVVQAVCAFFGFGCDFLDRSRHCILATPDRQARRNLDQD